MAWMEVTTNPNIYTPPNQQTSHRQTPNHINFQFYFVSRPSRYVRWVICQLKFVLTIFCFRYIFFSFRQNHQQWINGCVCRRKYLIELIWFLHFFSIKFRRFEISFTLLNVIGHCICHPTKQHLTSNDCVRKFSFT